MILPLANGEPVGLLDVLERENERLSGVRVHQMHALQERPYLHGAYGDRLRHVSYFLSHATRKAYWEGGCELVPNHFSEMPRLLELSTRQPVVLAAASPPDRAGYFSLGTNADYVASLIGKVPFFLEVNARMPRTFGLNQIHASQLLGYCETDRPLVEVPPAAPDERDRRIAAYIVERIPDGATLQVGIGGVPNAVLEGLGGHRDLGIHTELLADGIVDLVEAGVATGVQQAAAPQQGRGDVLPRHAAALRLAARQRRGRAAAGRPRQRPAPDRARGRLHLDQRHDRGRPLRPVRVGDDRRPLLVLERRPGRLRARRDVLAPAGRRSSCCTRPRARAAAGSARG